jgi:intracellular sulfur oxidation DsrE/DsrF family protein
MSTKLKYCAIAGLMLIGAVPPLMADPSAASPGTAPSQAPEAALWVYPVIKGYGGVHPRPDLPAGLMPGVEYKVIADVAHDSANRTKVSGSLFRLARLVNLMAYAGVPHERVHIAAVIEGEAGFVAFTNAAYRKRFHVDNPNLALLHELEQSGVELMVCSQALAENDVADNDISPDVHVTLSALTDFALYGQRGYSYLQL